jgi:hypothetical protein
MRCPNSAKNGNNYSGFTKNLNSLNVMAAPEALAEESKKTVLFDHAA